MLRLLSIAAMIAVLLSGCGGSPSVDNLPSLTGQMVEIMKTIKDADSAKSAAPKLEALAEEIHALQKEAATGNGAAPSNPEKFMRRQSAAIDAYGREMTRISSIPGAAQALQGMLKKMTPDGEMVAAFNANVGQALGEQNLSPGASGSGAGSSPKGKAFDLRPDPNFKGPIVDVHAPPELSKWFPTAKKGDFIEIETSGLRTRQEVIEVAGEFVIIATVNQLGSDTGKSERRVRMDAAPPGKPLPPPPSWYGEPVGLEALVVSNRPLECQIMKSDMWTHWICGEVPFDQIVKAERAEGVRVLRAFGRGTGPSPIIPEAVASLPTAPLAPPPQAQAANAAPPSPPPPTASTSAPAPATAPAATVGNDPHLAQKIDELETSIEEFERQIERLKVELNEAQTEADRSEKKLKRLSMASTKSRRGRDARGEFERELHQSRSEITRIKHELKRNEEQLSRAEKQLETYQQRMVQMP